jgi:hypothetical protein
MTRAVARPAIQLTCSHAPHESTLQNIPVRIQSNSVKNESIQIHVSSHTRVSAAASDSGLSNLTRMMQACAALAIPCMKNFLHIIKTSNPHANQINKSKI